ncbi:MAG: adenylate/guanylate cyclase domain-containing protein, partial [Myxococcales bacterium]|nr:adenylate/guanylate cyclase domain-containing protein [Myxococcales bacterium]
MSERLGAKEVVKVLNEYFEIMVEIIFEHEGTLDKFIGDAIMAIWGAPFTTGDDAYNAVAASVKMQRALREFNDVRIRADLEPIEIGVGLDTGHIVAGYMGSSRKLEYTVIGDSVNRAARLCSLAAPTEILVSEETLKHVGNRAICEEREPARLKGISKLVNNYLVKGLRYPT